LQPVVLEKLTVAQVVTSTSSFFRTAC